MAFLPKTIVTFSTPSRPEDMAARHHNRIAKDALREALAHHHRQTIGKHFSAEAAGRYGYAARSPNYLRRKLRKKGHQLPLVYSGATKRAFTRPGQQIRVGGTAEAGSLTASIVMRFPFAQRARASAVRKGNRPRRNPKTQQLASEVARWTDDEAHAARDDFLKRYMEKLAAHRGRRKRKRVPIT